MANVLYARPSSIEKNALANMNAAIKIDIPLSVLSEFLNFVLFARFLDFVFASISRLSAEKRFQILLQSYFRACAISSVFERNILE